MAKKTAGVLIQAKLAPLNQCKQGGWRLGFYRRNAVSSITGAVSCGIAAFLASIPTEPVSAPRRCLTCETAFRHEQAVAALAVIAPDVPGEGGGFIGGICLTCAARQGLIESIRATYAARMGVSVRIIDGDNT